jgi:hypothetical protein
MAPGALERARGVSCRGEKLSKGESRTYVTKSRSMPRSWGFFNQTDRSKIAFVTIIISGIKVGPDTPSESVLGDILNEMADFKKKWIGLTRTRRISGLRMRGFFEIDLCRSSDIHGHRRSLFEDMLVPPISDHERIINLHIHLLVACTCCTVEKLAEELKRTWLGRWRIVVKPIYENQATEVAISNLYGYMTKQIFRYSCGGIGNEAVTFNREWEPLWMRKLKNIALEANVEFRSSDRWVHIY